MLLFRRPVQTMGDVIYSTFYVSADLVAHSNLYSNRTLARVFLFSMQRRSTTRSAAYSC
jgi:hypothetical protein